MYQQYFHFDDLPFSIAPDPQFMYMSERHQEGLAHLLYGVGTGGGFVALTGEVGTGKTSLCHCFMQQLPPHVDLALILNPKLNALELLATICDELGIEYAESQVTLKCLIDKINHSLLAAYAKGRSTVLLIDEAQNLSLEVLEQIRLLTNLETSKAKLLQIVLVGQPELKALLNQPNLRQLNQRITARYHLLPLTLPETRCYVQHRLRVCHGDPDLFKEQAIRKIFSYSGGIPRLINVICDRALLGAYANDERRITPRIVDRAAQETLGYYCGRHWLKGLAVSVFLSVAVVGVYWNGYLEPWLQKANFAWLEAEYDAGESIAIPGPKSMPQTISESVAELVDQDFASWLQTADLPLNAALLQALQVWGKSLPAAEQASCDYAANVGLECLQGKLDLEALIALERPAILIFSLESMEKRYALLVAVDRQRAILRFGDERMFPLAEVMQVWQGDFILLWQSPLPEADSINPWSQSDAVTWLRKQLHVAEGTETAMETKPSPVFDRALINRVQEFQTNHHLQVDGIVGSYTLIHLDNEVGLTNSPHLALID